MRIRSALLIFVTLAFASACANSNSIYRRHALFKGGQTEKVDAKQRAIIAVPYYDTEKSSTQQQPPSSGLASIFGSSSKPDGYRVCAEAAPDVFSIYALGSSAQGNASTNGAEETSINAALALSVSENGATIERTQTINLIRESMYRTCERYLSGAIDKTTMQVQAARDQRAMVAILAIEQLTGVVKRRPTILSSDAQASLVTANMELLEREMAESKVVDQKQSAFEDATKKHGTAKAEFEALHGGKCTTILETPVPDSADSIPSDETGTKTVTQTSTTPDGTTQSIEASEPATPEPSPVEQATEEDAADLTKQKAECQGAKTASAKAEIDLKTSETALSEAKAKHKATQELLTKLSATLLQTSAGGQGSGDSGSSQSAEQIEKVATSVENIAKLAFDNDTEMIYVCTSIIGQIQNYKEAAPHQQAFISGCFSLLGGDFAEGFKASLAN